MPPKLKMKKSRLKPRRVFAVGDRVQPTIPPHMPGAEGPGTIETIDPTQPLGIRFDAMPNMVHKWYTASEVEAVKSNDDAKSKMKMKAQYSIPSNLRLCAGSGSAILEAAAPGEEGAKKLRKFRMEAYNGGAMNFRWSDVPVVVDLAGLRISAKARPVLKDHIPSLVVGHSEKITVNAGKTLVLEGIASGTGPSAKEVISNADNGFPWQASIGADILRLEEVKAGVEVTVNHQKFTGPILVVRASRLGEVSFVALGADDSTEVRLTATRIVSPHHEENSMDFEAWLQAKGFTLAELNETQKATLQAAFDSQDNGSETEVPEDDEDDESEEVVEKKTVKAKVSKTSTADIMAARKAQADETRRIAGIRKICAGKHADIEIKAIEDGSTVEKAELLVMRASRTGAPNIGGSREQGVTASVLEAAVLQAARAPEAMVKSYGDKVLQAAHTAFRGRIGLQELLLEAAWANGYAGRSFKQNHGEVLRAAFGHSTIDVSGILSNIANKFLLDGFTAVDQAWREVGSIGSVSDFKQITRYRLIGDEIYEKVSPGGQLKHGTLDEESYTNQAETYGKMYGITRQDQINDDLGALTAIPRKLGRGAGLKLNSVFWTEFMDNSTFYTLGRLNYQEGAATTMTLDGLTTAEQLFMDQVDGDGNPLAIAPRRLLVPTALSVKAQALYNSTEVRDTTANTKAPVGNPHAGKWKPITTPYLSNANIPGFSSLAWYLLADPADLAVIETVFLNGQESPTVESAEADFSVLGVQMRGFHDFGVRKQEYRAGIKSKGQA